MERSSRQNGRPKPTFADTTNLTQQELPQKVTLRLI